MARRNEAEVILSASDRTKGAFNSVNQNFGKFIGAAGVAGAVFALQRLTREGLRNVDALAKQSQKLGLATRDLAALRLAAEKTGNSQKQLDLGLQRVTRRIAEAAQGSGEAVKALEELGLEADVLANKTPDEQMLDLADAFEKVDGQSNKVRLGFKLFDSEGVGLINTLELGREGLLENAEAVDRFGTAISAVNAKQIEEAVDSATDLREAFRGLSTGLAFRFAPAITDANGSLANFVARTNDTYIPAFVLLGEQITGVQTAAKALSETEINVRIQVQEDELAEINSRLETFLASGRSRRLQALEEEEATKTEIQQKRLFDRQLQEFEAERIAAQTRLDELKGELQRRSDLTLESDRKLADERQALQEQLRLQREEEEREKLIERAIAIEEIEQQSAKRKIAIKKKEIREINRILDDQIRKEDRDAREKERREQQQAIATVKIRQSVTTQSIAALALLAGRSSGIAKAIFLVEKGLAIGRTIVNTSAAAMKALAELGPVAGPPAAAAIKARGAAEVALIAATGIVGISGGGGGGGGGLGAGAALPSASAANDPAAFGLDDDAAGGTPAVSQGVTQLIFPNLFGITPEAVDQLADALRDASENRDVLVVAGTGRNAEILGQGANG